MIFSCPAFHNLIANIGNNIKSKLQKRTVEATMLKRAKETRITERDRKSERRATKKNTAT